jgi:hypothetical protein
LVSFVVWKRFFAPLKDMTARRLQRLQNFFAVVVAVLAAASVEPTGAWHKHLYTRSCNQSAVPLVMLNGVDALLIAWMILMQALWLKLRFKTTTKQLASWCDSFIRWWPGSSVRIGRVERQRRTFAR